MWRVQQKGFVSMKGASFPGLFGRPWGMGGGETMFRKHLRRNVLTCLRRCAYL